MGTVLAAFERPDELKFSYADEEVQAPWLKDILRQKMWSYHFGMFPDHLKNKLALYYFEVKQGKVYRQCFQNCRDDSDLLVAMLWESQEELETCLPDLNFWIYLYDDIGV